VEELLPEGGVGAVIADFSVGKTWLMIDLGMSIAFGGSWFGKVTKQRPVLFLIAEGNQAFPMRVLGWLVGHGLLPEEVTLEEMFEILDGRVVINRYPARFDDPDFSDGVIATVEATGAGLVIIDTLGKTLGTDQGENDNDVANGITGMLSEVAARTGCTAIFTHHVGLAAKGRARGASAWEQGLDFAYLIVGSREDLDQGRAVSLVGRKARDFSIPPAVGFRLERLPGLSVASKVGAPSVSIDSAVVKPVAPAPKPAPIEARVLMFVPSNPGCAKGPVESGVVGETEKVRTAIAELREMGAIENRGSATRHAWHVVDGWGVSGGGEVVNIREVFVESPPHDASEESSDG
jgi:hypothetical protein